MAVGTPEPYVDTLVTQFKRLSQQLDRCRREQERLGASRAIVLQQLTEAGLSQSLVAKLTDLTPQRVAQILSEVPRRVEAVRASVDPEAVARGEQCPRCGGAIDSTFRCVECGTFSVDY